ncbi:MAG: N-acetylmuramoyl-L-alanine amidase [Flavobacterium sp.]|nr:N-acetylmuramoyl-L-alanine amidase [Flavobacterium sp.]
MKKVSGLFLTLLIATCFAFTYSAKQINVVIDAGHGGHDHGASTELHTEKHITQRISDQIEAVNQNQNIAIHRTRKTDEFVELANRAKFANEINADILLSLHVNSSPQSHKSGIDLFIGKDTKTSKESQLLAEKLKAMFEENGFKVNSIQEAPFMILKKAEVPAIIVELGYISNKQDAEYLTNEKSQEKLANIFLEFASGL